MSEKHLEVGVNQDNQLHHFQKDYLDCTIITTKGVPIMGTIKLYDSL